jgi:hypothetical protein
LLSTYDRPQIAPRLTASHQHRFPLTRFPEPERQRECQLRLDRNRDAVDVDVAPSALQFRSQDLPVHLLSLIELDDDRIYTA